MVLTSLPSHAHPGATALHIAPGGVKQLPVAEHPSATRNPQMPEELHCVDVMHGLWPPLLLPPLLALLLVLPPPLPPAPLPLAPPLPAPLLLAPPELALPPLLLPLPELLPPPPLPPWLPSFCAPASDPPMVDVAPPQERPATRAHTARTALDEVRSIQEGYNTQRAGLVASGP